MTNPVTVPNVDGLTITITNTPEKPAISPWGKTEIVFTSDKDPSDVIVIDISTKFNDNKGKGKHQGTFTVKDCDH